jgi:glutaredoxin
MRTLTLYTKEGCGLCEEVKRELAALAAAYPHRLVEVDITTDPALLRQYHLTIPVLQVGDITLEAPITRQVLVAALERD